MPDLRTPEQRRLERAALALEYDTDCPHGLRKSCRCRQIAERDRLRKETTNA